MGQVKLRRSLKNEIQSSKKEYKRQTLWFPEIYSGALGWQALPNQYGQHGDVIGRVGFYSQETAEQAIKDHVKGYPMEYIYAYSDDYIRLHMNTQLEGKE